MTTLKAQRIRNKLLKEETELEGRGRMNYIDGVLDFYNELTVGKKETNKEKEHKNYA